MGYIKGLNSPVITTKAQTHDRTLKKKRNIHEELSLTNGISISLGGERLIKEMLLLFLDRIQDISIQQMIAWKVCILNSHLLTHIENPFLVDSTNAILTLQFFRFHLT